MNFEKLAEIGYASYCEQAGGKTFDGKPLPTFAQLGQERQECWKAGVKAVLEVSGITLLPVPEMRDEGVRKA